MTPEERSKEMSRRRRKWSPEARAKWRHEDQPSVRTKGKAKPNAKTANSNGHAPAARRGRGPAPRLTEEQVREKQRIYQARSKARTLGEPLPPLPPKIEAAPSPEAAVQ